MNCQEFDQTWNEVLDIFPTVSADRERSLEAHSEICSRCRGVGARYQVLRQALSVWGPPPTPSMALTRRIEGLTVPVIRRNVRDRPARRWGALAAAATIFGLAWLGLPRTGGDLSIAPPRPIGSALAAATVATLDLAREASGPAARIGRDVFEPESQFTLRSIGPTPTPALATATSADRPDLFRSMGDRVKPISGSARHAFSFLLGPASDSRSDPTPPREDL